MIKDLGKTTNFIVGWIEAVARSAKAKSLVVGVSGGVDSAVVLALAKRTTLPVHAVYMPCHSSPSSKTRAQEAVAAANADIRVTEENMTQPSLDFYVVDLEESFQDIEEQVTADSDVDAATVSTASSSLRSTLRAPVLDYVAKLYNGVVIGTGNRDEDEVTRYFQKRGDGAVDASPIAKLHKSEVYELAKYLGVPQSIIDAAPSADLLGPDSGQTDEEALGLTYAQIEQATRLVESIYGTTQGEAFLQLARTFGKFGAPDTTITAVLEKLGKMEMVSRHKSNPSIPVCNVREPAMGLVE